jgi:hypothetical protein
MTSLVLPSPVLLRFNVSVATDVAFQLKSV